MTPRNLLAGALALLSLCAAAGTARAGLTPPVVTLPGYSVYQDTACGFSQVSCTLAEPNCAYGSVTVSDTLGGNPNVALQVNYEPFITDDGTIAGGFVQSQLTYYVEYVLNCAPAPSCTPSTAPVSVSLTDSASMTSAPSSYNSLYSPYVQAYVSVGSVFSQTSCIQYCIAGVADGNGPLPYGAGIPVITSQTITLDENTRYLVTIGVAAESIGPATAEVDPTFTVPGGSGQFVFSSGIESATPEPSYRAMMLVGFGLLAGARLRRKANAGNRG